MDQVAQKLPEVRAQKNSLIKDDDGRLIRIVIPWHNPGPALPDKIPASAISYGFDKVRDNLLLSTPKYEAQWATSITTAISKVAAMAWELSGPVKTKRDRYHEILLNFHAGMGIYGWIPGISVGLRSFFTTGYQLVEIERSSKAGTSKAVALHNINPLKALFTGDSLYPIEVMNGAGEFHKIPWHNVMVIGDVMNLTDGDGLFESAAVRAYPQIKKLSSIEQYVYEKVSGRRPQSIYFVGGVLGESITEAIATAKNDANSENMTAFMGAAMVPVMGDVPVSLAEIPLAEMPDGFDAKEERLHSAMIYASALGLDFQSVNPQLLGGQGMGSTGNQSQVLKNKEKQSGIAAWKQQWTHLMNELVLDQRTLFSFKEIDLDDQGKEADTDGKLIGSAVQAVSGQLMTPAQAVNWLVDRDVLPIEFAQADETAGETITDTQISKDEENKPISNQLESNSPAAVMVDKEKSRNVWEDLLY